MAVPKKKKSRSKIGARRSHDHISVPAIVECPTCGEPKVAHHVCPNCGKYAGRVVIESEEE